MPRYDNSHIVNNDNNNFPSVLTMWRAERVISRVEGNDGYTEIIHSVVGRAVMVELLLTLVAKHGKY